VIAIVTETETEIVVIKTRIAVNESAVVIVEKSHPVKTGSDLGPVQQTVVGIKTGIGKKIEIEIATVIVTVTVIVIVTGNQVVNINELPAALSLMICKGS
jgi:hypothetical protein